MTKTYAFDLRLFGQGDTPGEAWDDAVAQFLSKPGPCPAEGVTALENGEGDAP